jgi:hypothetical protein
MLAGFLMTFAARGASLNAEGGAVGDVVEQRPEYDAPEYYGSSLVEVIVDGLPRDIYQARGRRYVEALRGEEYALRVRNPFPVRVAVSLSVDGLNTIDGRRTSRWDASKWVIEPYQTVTISGWQVSRERARRFYFTTERDSYASKMGRASDLGVITAVFFRERGAPVPLTRSRPSTDPQPEPRSHEEKSGRAESPSRSGVEGSSRAQKGVVIPSPAPADDYAATGIGRSVHHDVRWMHLDLDPRPAAEVTIRYEYRDALVRLGVLPRPYPEPDPLRRRERARGFEEPRYAPEP